MKRKLLLTLLMVAMLVCMLALVVSARTDYRQEHTYNYYDTEGNLLYSATTIYAKDSVNKDKYRFETTIDESDEMNFAKVDENGNALTWYVVSDDKDANGDGTTNIVVASVLTSAVGATDGNGQFTYNDTVVNGVTVTAKNVVSASFFGMNIKKFPDSYFKATATSTPNGSTSEYCQMTDGSYLLAIYLPKTLTSIPNYLCQRTPVRIVEFEDNMVTGKININGGESGPKGPFAFCANLKAISIPEGVVNIATAAFRECIGLKYVKIANTVTRVEDNAFFRCSNIETFIMGEKLTFCGYINKESQRFHVEDERPKHVQIKYYYVSPLLKDATSTCNFEFYRCYGNNNGTYGNYKDVIFMFPGSIADAMLVGAKTGDSFKCSYDATVAAKKGLTFVEPISYEEYLANKTYYDVNFFNGESRINNKPVHLLVYDVPFCTAFYNGEHDLAGGGIHYTSTLDPVTVGDYCARCDYNESETYKPLLTFLGYSAQIGGDKFCVGYSVNQETQAFLADMALSYGLVVTVPAGEADLAAYEPLKVDENGEVVANVENTVLCFPVENELGAFELIVNSFDAAHHDKNVVMCAYVKNGNDINYLSYFEGEIAKETEYAIPTTFTKIAIDCAEKYTVTYDCNDKMGTLSGETSQTLFAGQTTTTVTATPLDGYVFMGWSNGEKDESISFTPDQNLDLVAYFSPVGTGLPVFSINTENGQKITSKDYYINSYITVYDTETGKDVVNALAEIKGRGNSTWDKFDKKPYKLKFDKKQDLFGYGKEKTWVLLADARDYSLVRNMLALNAGLSMSELGYTSHGQSVEVYLNGEYQGVYYLCEQIQVKENRVNITQEDEEIEQGPDDVGYLIEMDAWVSDSVGGINNIPEYGVTSDGDVYVKVVDGMYNGYVIKDPEDILFDADGNLKADFMTYIQTYIRESLAAVSGDDYAKVCEYINVKSFAQAYIIFDLFKNPDTQYSSVYFYKDVNGKLVAAPLWDFDMSVGNVTHKANAGQNAQNFRDTSFLWTAQKNTWFRELLEFEDFRNLVGQELVDNFDNIMGSITKSLTYAREHEAAYEKNFTKWNLIGNTGATEKMGAWSVPYEFKQFADWNDHLDYIENYLEESYANLMATYPVPTVAE